MTGNGIRSTGEAASARGVRLIASALIATFFTAGLPARAANWADNKESYTQTAEYAQSKAICRSSRKLALPDADRPDPAAAATLKGCSSEALYYGIGRSPDPVRARQCAFLERTARNNGMSDFSGDVMLMTIYANGIGAERNLDLAIALACRIDGAPAEIDGRVKHLAALKAEHWTGHDFSLCDDATSGYLGGVCTAHDAAIADAKRKQQFAALTAGWSEAEKNALATLQKAEKAFADELAGKEVDQSGTLRAAFSIDEEQKQQQDLLDMLSSLAAGTAPAYNAQQFEAADAKLNDVYQKVQRSANPNWGTVTKDRIRRFKRAWLRYRDAWVAFAKVKYPAIASTSISTWLTEKRAAMLEQFLGS